MKHTLTIIAIVVVAVLTIVGITTGLSHWLGDMFFDWDERTWV